jgi:hypothetical protein
MDNMKTYKKEGTYKTILSVKIIEKKTKLLSPLTLAEIFDKYEFIKDDLRDVFKNPDIDWIMVHQHKDHYSTKHNKTEANELRYISSTLSTIRCKSGNIKP